MAATPPLGRKQASVTLTSKLQSVLPGVVTTLAGIAGFVILFPLP